MNCCPHGDSSWPCNSLTVLLLTAPTITTSPPSKPPQPRDKEKTKIIFINKESLSFGKFCKFGLLRFLWIFPAICLYSMHSFATPTFHFEFQVQTRMLKAQIETHLKPSGFTCKTVGFQRCKLRNSCENCNRHFYSWMKAGKLCMAL